MGKHTVDQHFIPKLYLYNFCNKDGKLFRYNCKYKDYSRKSPEQTCYIKYLYETKIKNSSFEKPELKYVFLNKIENHFSERETVYAKCIRQIIKICLDKDNKDSLVCSSSNKHILLEFIANLYVRNPITMEENKLDEIEERFKELVDYYDDDELLKPLGLGNITETVLLQSRKEMWLMSDKKDGYIDKIIYEIKKLKMIFWVSMNANFIFSNFPVFIRLDKNNNLFMVMLPLSPKCCVVFVNENEKTKDVKNNRIRYIDDEFVYKTNDIIIHATEHPEYLFANKKEDIEESLKYGRKND